MRIGLVFAILLTVGCNGSNSSNKGTGGAFATGGSSNPGSGGRTSTGGGSMGGNAATGGIVTNTGATGGTSGTGGSATGGTSGAASVSTGGHADAGPIDAAGGSGTGGRATGSASGGTSGQSGAIDGGTAGDSGHHDLVLGPRTLVQGSTGNAFTVANSAQGTTYQWTITSGTLTPSTGNSINVTAPALPAGAASLAVDLTLTSKNSLGTSSATIVPLMIVATIPDSSALTRNFVFNGEFKHGTAGYEMKKYALPTYNPQGAFDPLGTDSAVFAPGGSQSLTFSNNYSDGIQVLSNSFPLVQGQVYNLSVYIKGSSATAIPVSVGIISADWQVAGGVNPKVTTTWQRVHGNFTASAYNVATRTYTVSIRANMNPQAAVTPYTIWMDQLQITPGTADAATYVPQADVEISAAATKRVFVQDEAVPLTVVATNNSTREVHGSIALQAVEDDSGQTPLVLDSWTVTLAPGEMRTFQKALALTRYGSYTVTPVSLFDATTSTLPAWFGKVGPYTTSTTPVPLEKHFVVGVNDALDCSDGYAGTVAMLNDSVDQYLSGLRLMGTRVVRLWDSDPVSWRFVEPNAPNLSGPASANFSFAYSDFIVNRLVSSGIQPLAVIVGGPGLEPHENATPKNTSATDPNCQPGATSDDVPAWLAAASTVSPNTSQYYLDACLQEFLPPNTNPTDAYPYFVSNLVTHYQGKVKYWEINNEANLFSPLSDYEPYLKSSSDIIRGIDPAAKVVGFCFNMGPNTLSGLKGYFGASSLPSPTPTTLAQIGLAASDVVSIHPYSASNLGENGSVNGGAIAADTAIATMNQELTSFGSSNMPLWVTEDYYLSDPNQAVSSDQAGTLTVVKARHVAQRFLTDLGEGVAQSMPVHSGTVLWKQTLNPEFSHFFTSSWTPSSLYIAYNALARLFEGAQPVAKKKWNGKSVCYVYSKDAHALAACWVYAQGAGSATLTLATTQVATYDVYGNLVNAATGSITLGPAPVYLVPDADTGVSDFSALIQAATVQ